MHKEYVTALRYHPKQADLFLAGGFSTGITCWDVRSNKCTSHYSGHFGQIQSLDFINEGTQFVSSAGTFCTKFILNEYIRYS